MLTLFFVKVLHLKTKPMNKSLQQSPVTDAFQRDAL